MEKKRGIDSFTLHILAMLFMLCDHLWATLFPAQECVDLKCKHLQSRPNVIRQIKRCLFRQIKTGLSERYTMV